MDKNTSRLAKWLRDQICLDRASGKILRFELRHLALGAKYGAEVCTIDLRDVVDTDSDWLDTTSASLFTTANADAEGLGEGTQKYVVLAYRSENPEVAKGRFPFMVEGPDKESPEGFDSEPPNAKGLTHQLMRHLEQKERIFTAALASIMQSQSRMLATVADENEKLRENRLESLTTVEELLSFKHERELESEKQKAHIELMSSTAKDLKPLAVSLVKYLTAGGKDKVDAMQGMTNMQLRGFVESLKPDQIETVFKTLNPVQQVALAEIIQQGSVEPDPSQKD
jgi:hypothetical protein